MITLEATGPKKGGAVQQRGKKGGAILLIRVAQKLLEKVFGARVVKLEDLQLKDQHLKDLNFLLAMREFDVEKLSDFLPESKAQLRQDLFVLASLNFKQNGFFVEFGASDGVTLSNTFLLEKRFGWRGILAEPLPLHSANLRRNRSAVLDFRCVYDRSGEDVKFVETRVTDLSTVANFATSDGHARSRRRGVLHQIETVTLEDLLDQHEAPRNIDYLSVDTEGSEFSILSNFPFRKYRFNVITVEHNYTQTREPIRVLLESHGYRRVFEALSQWDDWYVQGQMLSTE